MPAMIRALYLALAAAIAVYAIVMTYQEWKKPTPDATFFRRITLRLSVAIAILAVASLAMRGVPFN